MFNETNGSRKGKCGISGISGKHIQRAVPLIKILMVFKKLSIFKRYNYSGFGDVIFPMFKTSSSKQFLVVIAFWC